MSTLATCGKGVRTDPKYAPEGRVVRSGRLPTKLLEGRTLRKPPKIGFPRRVGPSVSLSKLALMRVGQTSGSPLSEAWLRRVEHPGKLLL